MDLDRPSADPVELTGCGPAAGSEAAASEPDPPERYRYSVPFGESGAWALPEPTRHWSLLKLVSFELQHAAAQRRVLRHAGQHRHRVDMRIKTAVGPDMFPVAVGGVTESHGDLDGNGAEELVMRELAVLASVRRLIATAGTMLFGLESRPMPLLRHSGTAASVYRAMQNRQALRAAAERPGLVEKARELHPQALQSRLEAFGPVEKSLRKLADHLAELREDPRLAALSVSGGEGAVVASVRSRRAAPGTYRVQVEQLAAAHTVESAPPPSLHPVAEPLALSGTFRLNGVDVAVAAGESLTDIAATVNSDTAAHGVTAEARDGRLILRRAEADAPPPRVEDPDAILRRTGVTFGTVRLGGVAVPHYATDSFHDLAARINRGHDTDGDGVLTGGTAAHGVVASVGAGGRLRLMAASAGAAAIEVGDPDGVFAALGLVERDAAGVLQFAREVTAPQASRVRVDGKTHRGGGNTLDEAIEGLRLRLTRTTEEAVALTVEEDAEPLAAALEGIIGRFNSAVEALNEALRPQTGLLGGTEHIARIRWQLRNDSRGAVPGQPEDYTYAEQAGVEPQPGERLAFHAAQLDAAYARLKQDLGRLAPLAAGAGELSSLQKQTGAPAVTNSLSRLGITGREDDTLQLDAARLREAVAEDRQAVSDLFGRADGWVPRLAQTAEKAVRPQTGLLALARRRVEALGGPRTREIFGRAWRATQAAELLQRFSGLLSAAAVAPRVAGGS